jgi:hypothetical protein
LSVVDGWVYYHDKNGMLSKVKVDGSQPLTLPCAINGSPAVSEGFIYFRGFDNNLYRIKEDGLYPECLIEDHTIISDPLIDPELPQYVFFVHPQPDNIHSQTWRLDLNSNKTAIFTHRTTNRALTLNNGVLVYSDIIANKQVYAKSDKKQPSVDNGPTSGDRLGNGTTERMVLFDGGHLFTYFGIGFDNNMYRVESPNWEWHIINSQAKFAVFSIKDDYIYANIQNTHQIVRIPKVASTEVMVYKGHPTCSVPFVADDGYLYYQGEKDGVIYKQLADATGPEIKLTQ